MLFYWYPSNKLLFFSLLVVWAGAWAFVFNTNAQKVWFFAALLLFVSISWWLVNLTPVQNYLVNTVSKRLSKGLQTEVSIKHVNFSLFNKMLVEGALVKDKKQDTLLYAGTTKVNITDWFFFKDKATLEYIGLDDAIVNLKRTDSVWNYQFLVDYFSSSKTSAGNKSGFAIDFKQIDINRTQFNKIDKWTGQDMIASINELRATADTINFDKNIFVLNKVLLDKPIFLISDYSGQRPENINNATSINKVKNPRNFKWNNVGLQLSVKSISIKNGSFASEKETERLPYPDKFDGQHLIFSAISGTINNAVFRDDTLKANINLSTKEKSGFEVKKIEAAMKFTPEIMEFANLNLLTPKSKLGNYYAMSYEGFNASMSDFLHSVKLSGNFKNSYIHSDDIAFFAPELKDLNRTFSLEGTAKGAVDNLSTKGMIIKSGASSIDGDIALRGLPDIKTTFIDLKANSLVTNYTELAAIIPSLKNAKNNLSKLGTIYFNGNFTGFINDFVTYGEIKSNLGNVIADINMKLPLNKTPTYSGKISTVNFRLGQFLNNNNLGSISLDGNVVGKGFTLKDLDANYKGNIHQLQFSGYNYKNLVIDGNFEKQIFSGHGTVNDSNLKIDKFDGTISLAGKENIFNFNADLKNANFKQLGWANEDFNLTGNFNLNFTGNNIDKFLGTAIVNNAALLHNGNNLSFDHLILDSYIENNKKYLSFKSNELEGEINGTFKILELPNAFKVFLNRYLPAYIPKPKSTISNQDFSFKVATKSVDQYIQLFDKRLKGFDNATFDGNLILAKNELNINATVPQFEYDGKIFNNVTLNGVGNFDTLYTKINTGDIVINDSLHFPGTNLSIKSNNDVSEIELTTSASKTLSEANLNATVKTLTDGVIIDFSPSSFIINDRKWQLENNGELTLRKAFIAANEIKFTQGPQEITFFTKMDDEITSTNLVAKLKKVNINDFTPLFLTNPRLEGVLTGNLILKNPFGKQIIDFDTEAENFALDNKKIGDTKLSGNVNTSSGVINLKSSANNDLYSFDINGSLNYKDSLNNQMNIALLAQKFDLSLLNNYLSSIFSDMKGNAESDLVITGGLKSQSYVGSVKVTEGSLKVNYTQCKYNFNNETITFNPGEINFGTIQLKDTLKNSGTLSGKMRYKNFFQDISFSGLRFETSKMLLLNTNKIDNSLFYGKVIGNAVMTLNGEISDMKMKIKGEPSALDTSHIYLVTSDSRESNVVDYIDFIQFGSEMEALKSQKGTNFFVDMDLTANPACKIDVILDETTGDVIKGQGNGLLNIKVGTKEPLSINGRYDITEGEYKFNFQTFIQKYFSINKGNITWNGDPLLAQINIDAEYRAPGVDLSPLATSRVTSNGSDRAGQKADLLIIAHLTETLKEPKISFEFAFPPDEKNETTNDPVVLENLKKFSRDENEQNRQVASLLLFNTFISDNNSGLGASTANFISGTAGQVISGFLNNQLTRVFQKLFNDPTITPYLTFNSTYNLSSTQLIDALAASGNFGFKKEYYNGRLIIGLGGNIDYNNPYILQARNTNVLLTPDITVEYILTADRKLRIVGFNRTSVDVTLGQRNRTGVRLSYQKEFDKKSNRPIKKEEILEVNTDTTILK